MTAGDTNVAKSAAAAVWPPVRPHHDVTAAGVVRRGARVTDGDLK
jgi:hypothetical protein